ncbi:MAG: hypothetical protein HY275_05015 [Gemmatimonadetes bacterium]|nr:hypothetical protein [Gemmatimonadota bacterium]
MSFVRGADAAADQAGRFREVADHFAIWREGRLWVARTDAPAERTVALFHALSAELPGTVSLSIARVRDGRGWEGQAQPLTDVREGIARLRAPLARTGGLEVTLWGDGRQLSLSAQLAVWTWAPTRAWRTALEAQGLHEVPRDALGDRRWAARADQLAGSRDLDEVTASVVARLGLADAVPPIRE